METWVIILSGGSGNRMGHDLPKQLFEITPGLTILDLSLASYQSTEGIDGICLVYNSDFRLETEMISRKYPKVKVLVKGGTTRQESVWLGLQGVDCEYVLIHDAARPIVHVPAVTNCISKLHQGCKAVNTIFQPPATMVVIEKDRMVGTMDRESIALGQCPQGFNKEALLDAHRSIAGSTSVYTDDCSIMITAGYVKSVDTVTGSYYGFKLTYPEDIEILRLLLAEMKPN